MTCLHILAYIKLYSKSALWYSMSSLLWSHYMIPITSTHVNSWHITIVQLCPSIVFDKHILQSSIINRNLGDKSAFRYHKGTSSSTRNQPTIMIKTRLLNTLQLKPDNCANTAFNTWRPREVVGIWLAAGNGQCKTTWRQCRYLLHLYHWAFTFQMEGDSRCQEQPV